MAWFFSEVSGRWEDAVRVLNRGGEVCVTTALGGNGGSNSSQIRELGFKL